jgi:hypothetical protein
LSIDITLINYFAPIILIIFLWSLIFALLQKSKYLTDNSNLNSIIALTLSIITLQATSVSNFITNLIPFFVFAVFVVFILTFLMYGAGIKKLQIENYPTTIWIIIIVFALIILWVGGNVWGNTLIEDDEGGLIKNRLTNTTDFNTNIINTLFNPKVAGAILLIAAIALIIVFIKED